jgi:hypothetical protein
MANPFFFQVFRKVFRWPKTRRHPSFLLDVRCLAGRLALAHTGQAVQGLLMPERTPARPLVVSVADRGFLAISVPLSLLGGNMPALHTFPVLHPIKLAGVVLLGWAGKHVGPAA